MRLIDRVLRVAFAAVIVGAMGCSSGGTPAAELTPTDGATSTSPSTSSTSSGSTTDNDAGTSAPLPATADYGFRPLKDGFPFPNYADLPGPGVFDAAGLRRMFGDKVCSHLTNDVCTPTPQGQDWIDKVNSSLQGGHCEGFAVLSLLLFNKWVDPTAFGASTAGELLLTGNGALNHELAYWYATQFLEDPVITSTHSFKAADAVTFLLGAFTYRTEDTIARIGLARIGASGALEGGHAITPYAVLEGEKPGTKKIMVYDSNHPGEEDRFIAVDMTANSWSYVAGTTPEEPSSLYAGDLTNKNRLYVAAAHPRLGVHACPFCDDTKATITPSVSTKHRSLVVQGGLDPVAVDSSGRRVGRVNGEVVNEMPGATITPGFSGGLWADSAPVQITLPASGDVKVSVTPRTTGTQTAAKSSVTLFGGGYSLGVEYPSGATVMGDTIGMPENAGGISLTSVGKSSATLAMAVETAGGGMVVHIAVADLPAGANVGLQTDAASGKVGVNVDSPVPIAVKLDVGIDKGDGAGKQVFQGAVKSSGADSVGVDLGKWTGGTDPLPITVAPSDGTPPKTVVVDNAHDYTPPAVDECTLDLSNCSVHALCTDTPTSFTCACKPGYGGDGVTCILGAPAPIVAAPLAPAIAYTFPNAPALLYTVGKLVSQAPPDNAGGKVDTFAIAPALPSGLAFDVLTGAIAGTPTAVTALSEYTVTATNVTGSATTRLTVKVQGPAPKIAYAAGTQELFRWAPAPPLAPTSSGGPALEYSIVPALPADLVFDPATGRISGTPTVLSPATIYTVTASNLSGSWPCSVSIAVVCAGGGACDSPPAVLLTGSASGVVGTGLVLQNNGEDDLAIAANGTFTFRHSLSPGSAYAVSVLAQPMVPAQTCIVANGSGVAPKTDIGNVLVTCTTSAFSVGGTITGLSGAATLRDGAGHELVVGSSGAFAFPAPLLSGSTYDVTVLSQPKTPVQTCTVTSGSGVVGAGNVAGIGITCVTTRFTVGTSIVGLFGSGLVLQNNGVDAGTVASDATTFTFATPIPSGNAYAVTIRTQPIGQTCSVAGGTGAVGAGDLRTVVVNCTANTYAVGGTLTGLVGTVILQNNAGDNLTLNSAGSFAFPSLVASGQPFSVTVLEQPSAPSQTCTITTGAAGVVVSEAITSVAISCTVNAFAVGGTISGLAGTVVLQNNSGDDLTLSSSGTFQFPSRVSSGASYAVTVVGQPSSPAQVCLVVSGDTGTVGSGPVSSVTVSCSTNRYAVGGTITGLDGTVVLQNNSGDDLTIAANGAFRFATSVASGATFAASIRTQPAYAPATQTCIVSAPSGTVGSADATGIVVTCTTNSYTVGGTVSGATGPLTLHDGGSVREVTGDGSFTFAAPVASGAPYAVTVSAAPPGQTCDVTSGSGTIASANVVDVTVTCRSIASSESCKSLLAANPVLPSGVYTLTGSVPYETYCDMTTGGGGWTLVMKLAAGDFCSDSANWTSGTALNEAAMVNTSFQGVGSYDAKSSAFHLVTDATSLRFDTASGGSVTTWFVSPASAQTLMTTNDVPFAAYPNRADWVATFGHDRDQAPIFMRAGVAVTDGNVCRTNPEATPVGCGKTCMFCYQASDGNCCGCAATGNDTNSGMGNGAAYCGGGLSNCSTGGSWSNSAQQALVWAR